MPFFRSGGWKCLKGKSDGAEDAKNDDRQEEECSADDVSRNTRVDCGGNSGGVRIDGWD